MQDFRANRDEAAVAANTIPQMLLQFANQITDVETSLNNQTTTSSSSANTVELVVSNEDWYSGLFNAAEPPPAPSQSAATAREQQADAGAADVSLANQRTLSADDNSVQCPTCHKSFRALASLNKHIVSMHDELAHVNTKPDETRFQCDLCGKIYTKKSYLLSHKRVVHAKQKFPCNICGKLYNWEANLQSHQVRVHSGMVGVFNFIDVDNRRFATILF